MSVLKFGFDSLYPRVRLRSAGKKKSAVTCTIIHTGGMQETKRLRQLADSIQQHARQQATLQCVKNRDGERMRTFYGIQNQQLPAVLITVEGGMLRHHWTKENIPSANDISFLLRQLCA
jgi:hypothetical protein